MGDGVCVPSEKEIARSMVAVRDNADAMPYIMMRRPNGKRPDVMPLAAYTAFQVLLVLLQLLLCVGAHVPGYFCAGLVLNAVEDVMPRDVGAWPWLPVIMLMTMTPLILNSFKKQVEIIAFYTSELLDMQGSHM